MIESVVKPQIFTDLTTDELIAAAVANGEGRLCSNGALSVVTGKRTGRSPKDRFILKDALTEDTVNWGKVNQPISIEKFNALWQKAEQYLQQRNHYVSHLRVGEDPQYTLPLKVITETAWHNAFAHNLFIQTAPGDTWKHSSWTIMSAANLKTDPQQDGTNSDGAVMIDVTERRVLLCGMRYAGEMKKAMFTVLNFFLPEHDVLPMHCAANQGKNGDTALFFGLSGTGKTTLSTDPERSLIGDDEHGWEKDGIFNFEGGCYAKCIKLSQKNEPLIWGAIRSGAIVENVVINEQGEPDYDDASLAQNSRVAYPRHFIEPRIESNMGPTPKAVIFLSCDLYGVLPPVALLSKEQAAYHFLSGYTALVGGTEIGMRGVKPTFSACFGEPFFPRHPKVYADLLIKRIEESGAQVYLVNTGWTGGRYGEGGQRFRIPVTRRVIHAILSGELLDAPQQELPGFNLRIPKAIDGLDPNCLDPRKAWTDVEQYEVTLALLMKQFKENFVRFDVSDAINKDK